MTEPTKAELDRAELVKKLLPYSPNENPENIQRKISKTIQNDIALLSRDKFLENFDRITDGILNDTSQKESTKSRKLALIMWLGERGWGKAPKNVLLGTDSDSPEGILERIGEQRRLANQVKVAASAMTVEVVDNGEADITGSETHEEDGVRDSG